MPSMKLLALGAVAILGLGGLLALAAYFQGRNKERARQSERALHLQQEVEDAVATARRDAGHFTIGADGVVRRVPDPPARLSGQPSAHP